jgi:hypothetical protein
MLQKTVPIEPSEPKKTVRQKARVKSDPTAQETVQWTVKGLDRQALELSRMAARKRGMKFGAWVAQALRTAAIEEADKEATNADILLNKISEVESKIEAAIGDLKNQANGIQHDVRVLQLLIPKSSA